MLIVITQFSRPPVSREGACRGQALGRSGGPGWAPGWARLRGPSILPVLSLPSPKKKSQTMKFGEIMKKSGREKSRWP